MANAGSTAARGETGGLVPAAVLRAAERRGGADRRTLSWRTVVRGAINPRRRAGRRGSEYALIADWHEPHLLFAAVSILLLSVADALLTLTLLLHGAYEANPFLAWVLGSHPHLFALIKMGLTGGGVVVLVALARARLFRCLRVGQILQLCLLVYIAVISWELWLLRLIV